MRMLQTQLSRKEQIEHRIVFYAFVFKTFCIKNKCKIIFFIISGNIPDLESGGQDHLFFFLLEQTSRRFHQITFAHEAVFLGVNLATIFHGSQNCEERMNQKSLKNSLKCLRFSISSQFIVSLTKLKFDFLLIDSLFVQIKIVLQIKYSSQDF